MSEVDFPEAQLLDPGSLRCSPTIRWWLLHNTEAKICQLPRLCDAGSFQIYPSLAGTSEEPDAVAQQDRREVNDNLVDEPFVDAHLEDSPWRYNDVTEGLDDEERWKGPGLVRRNSTLATPRPGVAPPRLGS